MKTSYPLLSTDHLRVEFLYLDRTRCDRCRITGEHLRIALDLVQPVLDRLGVTIAVRLIHVNTLERARELQLETSPTVRVNGRDVQPEPVESSCGSCGDLAGVEIACREWEHRGVTHDHAPVSLLIDALLGAVYGRMDAAGTEPETDRAVPVSLRRFFDNASAKRGPSGE